MERYRYYMKSLLKKLLRKYMYATPSSKHWCCPPYQAIWTSVEINTLIQFMKGSNSSEKNLVKCVALLPASEKWVKMEVCMCEHQTATVTKVACKSKHCWHTSLHHLSGLCSGLDHKYKRHTKLPRLLKEQLAAKQHQRSGAD